jgi:Ca2+/H+ antiporter
MNIIARELRESPLLWPLVAVLAIVPLAALLSKATESVAAKTGNAVGGLLNATLGNLTELVIALTALRAGMFDLVKASIAGAIMTNSLFMLGMALLLGGLKYRTQEFNRATARFQSGVLLLAAIALLVPSMVGSSSQIALFVAPVLVLLSLFIAPAPMDLRFWPGAVVAVMISMFVVTFVISNGRSAWYVGVLLLVIYATIAMTQYLMPPAAG